MYRSIGTNITNTLYIDRRKLIPRTATNEKKLTQTNKLYVLLFFKIKLCIILSVQISGFSNH